MTREAAKTGIKSIYSVHPSVRMVQKAIESLPAKTGRSLDSWIRFINTHGPATAQERREWLKKEHGLGTNYAGWLAERAEGKGEDGDPTPTCERLKGTWIRCSRAQRNRCVRSTTSCSNSVWRWART
jgi:Domain of unknown function (DUF4287)